MKYLILFTLLSLPAVAQDCIYPPENWKIVFVPWFVPVDEITWKTQIAKAPEKSEKPECDRHLVAGGAPVDCTEEEN